MDSRKDERWRQRFENFEKSYQVLEHYGQQSIHTELERAGLIQLFEVTFELAWKTLKDYLESEGYLVKSPRETLKVAFEMEVIEEGKIWLDALSSRNLAKHTYNEILSAQLIGEIKQLYLPCLGKLYEKLAKER